jgi:hypothetical protein
MQISINQPSTSLAGLVEKGRQDADADMQMLAIADDGGKKRQHDHQQDGDRLRP